MQIATVMQAITPAELKEKLSSGEVIHLVDVREPYENDEFNIGGHNFPLGELMMHEDELKAMSQTGDIVFYCRSGNRSSMAQKILSMRMGINNTINLHGGMIAWQQEL